MVAKLISNNESHVYTLSIYKMKQILNFQLGGTKYPYLIKHEEIQTKLEYIIGFDQIYK